MFCKIKYDIIVLSYMKEEYIMALVSCTECGCKHLSDSIPKCPGCGYAVGEHFKRLYRPQSAYMKKKWELRDKEEEEWNNLQPELNRKIEDLKKKYELPPRPTDPKQIRHLFYVDGHITAFTISLIFILGWIPALYALEGDGMQYMVFIIGVIGIGLAMKHTNDSYLAADRQYQKEDTEWFKMKTEYPVKLQEETEKIRDIYREYAFNLANYGSRMNPELEPQKPSVPKDVYEDAEKLGYKTTYRLKEHKVMIQPILSDTEHYICCPTCGKILNNHPDYCPYCNETPKTLRVSKYPAKHYSDISKQRYAGSYYPHYEDADSPGYERVLLEEIS